MVYNIDFSCDEPSGLANGETRKGIDISKWQKGKIDWAKLAKSVQFVIIRAGYGHGNVDECAHEFASNCKKVGIPFGFYWYNAEKALARDWMFMIVKKLKDFADIYKPEYPVFYDIENRKSYHGVSDDITNFLELCLIKRLYPGIYGSDGVLYPNIKEEVFPTIERQQAAIWIARYSKSEPVNGEWDIWQKTSEGNISGVKGNVDVNVCRVDYPKYIKEGHYNGY